MLLDRMREALRVRHYSYRTEQAYLDWARRYILFHGKRHPAEMGAAEVGVFLTHLATERQASASTQNQAKAALLFLYGKVLGVDLPWLGKVVQAKVNKRRLVFVTDFSRTSRRLLGLFNRNPARKLYPYLSVPFYPLTTHENLPIIETGNLPRMGLWILGAAHDHEKLRPVSHTLNVLHALLITIVFWIVCCENLIGSEADEKLPIEPLRVVLPDSKEHGAIRRPLGTP